MATSDSRFKAFKFNPYSKPPPLPPKDPIYLGNNSSSIDFSLNSPVSPLPMNSPTPTSDRTSSRKDKTFGFLKFPRRSPRSQNGDGSGEDSIIIIGNDDLENPPPPEPDSQISTPWNFQHNIHVDEAYIGLPPSWATSLASAGFTPEEIADIQARRTAGSLAPDLRYLLTERPTSPQVADFQSSPEVPILTNPTLRSASLPLRESARPTIPKLVTSSSATRRPPPKRKPPLPTEELSQNGHKPSQSSLSTTHQSSDSHQSNPTASSSHSGQSAAFSSTNKSTPYHFPSTSTSNLSSHSGHSTADEDGHTPLARAPLRPSPYSNNAHSHSSPAAQIPSTRFLPTAANAPSEFGVARNLEQSESEDRPTMDDRVVAPKSIWGTKRTVIPLTAKSNPSLSSLGSSTKTPSSSTMPLYLQQQQMSQSALASSSFVAAASSSLSTLKVAAASTSVSIAAAVRNTKGVISRGLGTSKDNGNSGSVENKEDEESMSDSLEIDATSGVDGEDALSVPTGLGGRKAVWQLYTRPKTLTDTSSRPLDGNQQQPTNTTNTTGEGGKILPFSKSLTRHVKKTSSQFSLSTQGSASQASVSAVAAAPGSGTSAGTSGSGDVMLINKHQNSESIASSLESIPEAEGSAGLPPHSYTMASDTAASSSSLALFKIPSVNPAELSPTRAPHLSLLHQNKGSLDLSLWSEALLSGLTRSTELDLGFTFRVGEKEAAEGGKGKARDNRDGEGAAESEVGVTEMEKGGNEKEPGSLLGTARPSGDASQPTNTNRNIPATAAAGMPRRYPPPARPIPPINDNDSNASSSTSIPVVENPPSYPTGRLRSDSRSKPTGLTAPPSANLLPFSPPPNGLVAHPHHHHGYGQSPKPPPAAPLPPPPPSALSNGLTTTSTTAAMALRGIISPPPPSGAPFTTANMLSSPPSVHLPQSLKSPTLSTSPNSAQLWSEIDNMMDPGLMQRIGLTAAGGADGGFPRDGINGSLKTAGGGSVLQAQGSSFPAVGLELDTDTSKSGVTMVTVGVIGSSPDQSAALTEGFSPILPFSPEEERVAATRVLRAGEGVLGTKAHGQEGERKHVEEREGEWGDSGYAERNLEEKREASEGGDYSDQEVPIVHISRPPGLTDRLLIPDNHLKQRDNGNRDSSRSSSSTLTAEAVAVAATTIVRNVSRARRAGAVVLKGGSNVNSALLTPTPASSSNNGIRSRNSPSPPSAAESKHPPSPLSSNFGNSSEESAGSLSNSLSPSSPSQDNYSTPTTDSASLASPLLYYLDGTQTPSPLPEKMAFGPLPPLPLAAMTKPQSSGMNAQNEGDVDKYDYNYSPGSDDEEVEDGAPFAYPDEATVEAVRASMAAATTAAVPVPRPTIVISHEPPSTAAPATSTTTMGTLSPFQQYRGWLSAVVAPLEEFIDECVDPRDHYLDLKEIAEGESGSVYSAYLNPATASKLRLSPLIKAKDEEEMAQHPEQVKLVAIKSVAIVPSGSPKLVDLQRELTLMKGLPGHENVLGMDGVYVDLVEDSLWVRMELMERSLADMVGLVGDGLMLPDRMLARFASDVLSALEYLQKHFIAHRDVRSDNLLLNKHGFLKLADFSNAVQVKKEFPMRSDLAGVIFWQAPEVRKPPYNVLQVDVWSLGATVWEMAQTEPPFSDTQHFGDRWPPLLQPELYSPAFHDFLRKCSEPALSRPNPSDLLKHPFVQNACGRPVIVHLLSQCMSIERTLQERANASP